MLDLKNKSLVAIQIFLFIVCQMLVCKFEFAQNKISVMLSMQAKNLSGRYFEIFSIIFP